MRSDYGGVNTLCLGYRFERLRAPAHAFHATSQNDISYTNICSSEIFSNKAHAVLILAKQKPASQEYIRNLTRYMFRAIRFHGWWVVDRVRAYCNGGNIRGITRGRC